MPPLAPKRLKCGFKNEIATSSTQSDILYPCSTIKHEYQIVKDAESGKIVVGLFDGETLIIGGAVHMQVISGAAYVLGHICNSWEKIYTINSPTSDSAVSITACKGENNLMDLNKMVFGKQLSITLSSYISSYYTVILLSSTTDTPSSIPSELVTDEDEELLSMTSDILDSDDPILSDDSDFSLPSARILSIFNPVQPEHISRDTHPDVITLDGAWHESLISIASCEHSITLVVGSRNVGKSTYCRSLLNSLLNTHERVALLDMDVGQGEFTTEGIVSLSEVTEPQLRCSTVAHVTRKSFSRVFVGEKTPENDPFLYNQVVYCPLVINTCGWIKGIGADVINSAYHTVNCSHVIFLQHADDIEECPIVGLTPSKLITIFAHEVATRKINAAVIRERKLVQYFCGEERRAIGDRLLQLPRYSIDVESLQCFVGKVLPKYYHIALKGMIVGLSIDSSYHSSISHSDTIAVIDTRNPIHEAVITPKILDHVPLCKNVGVGIVHSIDIRKNKIIIITPLSSEEMKDINTLIRSTQIIPQSFLENSLPLPMNFFTSNIEGVGCIPAKARTNLKRIFPSRSLCLSYKQLISCSLKNTF